MTKRNLCIGIDLGTTTCCVYYRTPDGRTLLIQNPETGNPTTPSVITINQDGSVIVGEAADRQRPSNGKNTFFRAKTFIGLGLNDKDSEAIAKILKLLPFQTTADSNNMIQFVVNGKPQFPSFISALILQYLKSMIKKKLDLTETEVDMLDVVVTVPAHFTTNQRRATQDAIKIAGLNCISLLNEPTAAAIAYGLSKDNKELIDKFVVVFDIGGGTCDISVLTLSISEDNETLFETQATNGDNFLGGENLDDKLINYLCDILVKEHPNMQSSINSDLERKERIREAAKTAKETLSSAMQTEIYIPYIGTDAQGKMVHFKHTLVRSKFEDLIRSDLQRGVNLIEQSIVDASIPINKIYKVLLVGGTSRIPLITQLIKDLFTKLAKKEGVSINVEDIISNSVDPDQAVAKGASLHAAAQKGEEKIMLLDTNPLSFGIETADGFVKKIMMKNTVIPNKANCIFTTFSDYQTAATIKIYQGERALASDNMLLGQFTVEGITAKPRGQVQIDVEFHVSADGTLTVVACEVGNESTKKKIVLQVLGSLSDEEIQKMQKDAKDHEERDKKLNELSGIHNRTLWIISSLNTFLNSEEVKSKADEAAVKEVLSELTKIEEDSCAALKDANKEQLEELGKKANEINDLVKSKYGEAANQPTTENTPPEGQTSPEGDAANTNN